MTLYLKITKRTPTGKLRTEYVAADQDTAILVANRAARKEYTFEYGPRPTCGAPVLRAQFWLDQRR